MICEVVINSSARQIDKTFEYIVPQKLIQSIDLGQRVFVPFGNQKIIGYVTKLKETSDYDKNKLKEIIEIIDLVPLLTKDNINLAYKMSKYFFTSFGKTLELFIPQGLRHTINKTLVIKNKENISNSLLEKFNNKESIIYNDKLKEFNNEIVSLIKNHDLEVDYKLSQKTNIKEETYIKFIKDYNGSSKKASELSMYLKELNLEIKKNELLSLGYSESSLNTLIKYECVNLIKKEVYRNVDVLGIENKNIILNSEQYNIYQSIKQNLNQFDTYLIHGVCGSGKTEIYLNLIEDVLKNNKSALMLVPEIALTPQMSSRFVSRFGSLVAIIHSSLSDGEKYDEYRRIKRGEAKVILGVRSAVFSPFQNLGIIIMDEEQEESYIQDSTPQYDTHFVCLNLAKTYNIPFILGSATPSINTYFKAKSGEYKLFTLYKRANNKPFEKSIVVDLKEELRSGNRSVFSKQLKEEIISNFNNNLQTILFINKRGFSSVVCRECGQSIKCPNCDVSLVYHKDTNKLKCHYCNYSIPNVSACPKCNSTKIRSMSLGTEKVEEEIKLLLPEAKTLRVDQDTMIKKDSHNQMTEKINNHEVDIIIGTQIVAKGLDFPLVSLVGVINADMGLNMPYYNAYEKTYNLLEQVTGRAGRKDTRGISIIQSYNCNAAPIINSASHSYLAFYNDEIKRREISNNPPFTNLIEILIKSKDQMISYNETKKVKQILDNKLSDSIILGPSSDRIYKLDNEFRYIITIKAKENANLDYLNQLYDDYKNISTLDLYIRRM